MERTCERDKENLHFYKKINKSGGGSRSEDDISNMFFLPKQLLNYNTSAMTVKAGKADAVVYKLTAVKQW